MAENDEESQLVSHNPCGEVSMISPVIAVEKDAPHLCSTYAGHIWSAFTRRPVSGGWDRIRLRKLLGMVEEILSIAQLHRYLLDVPSLAWIEVRYNSTNELAIISAMREKWEP